MSRSTVKLPVWIASFNVISVERKRSTIFSALGMTTCGWDG
jgi:hypothetical protein